MNAPSEILAAARRLGLNLRRDGGILEVWPADRIDVCLREVLTTHKAAILALLDLEARDRANGPLPYLTPGGTLVIPTESPARYHWWNGGQSVADTLTALNAPEDIRRRYLGTP